MTRSGVQGCGSRSGISTKQYTERWVGGDGRVMRSIDIVGIPYMAYLLNKIGGKYTNIEGWCGFCHGRPAMCCNAGKSGRTWSGFQDLKG